MTELKLESKLKSRKEFLDSFVVDAKKHFKTESYAQRSDDWHDARKYRITASNFGAAAGNNKFCTQKALIKQLLWRTFNGCAATRYGTEMEPVALLAYETYMNNNGHPTLRVEERGLMICKEWPVAGVSPDGIVFEGERMYLLEIKCPYSQKVYPEIPHYYYDQIQGIMGFMRMDGFVLDGCDFVVYTKEVMSIRHYVYDKEYFEKVLFPRVERFYMESFIDAARYHEAGLLPFGEISPYPELQVISPFYNNNNNNNNNRKRKLISNSNQDPYKGFIVDTNENINININVNIDIDVDSNNNNSLTETETESECVDNNTNIENTDSNSNSNTNENENTDVDAGVDADADENGNGNENKIEFVFDQVAKKIKLNFQN